MRIDLSSLELVVLLGLCRRAGINAMRRNERRRRLGKIIRECDSKAIRLQRLHDRLADVLEGGQ